MTRCFFNSRTNFLNVSLFCLCFTGYVFQTIECLVMNDKKLSLKNHEGINLIQIIVKKTDCVLFSSPDCISTVGLCFLTCSNRRLLTAAIACKLHETNCNAFH